MTLVRVLRDRDVHVDVVPRMYEHHRARASTCTCIEGLPLLALRPPRLSRAARAHQAGLRRRRRERRCSCSRRRSSLDRRRVAPAARRGRCSSASSGSAMDRREFTCLKFRTMRVDTDPTPSTAAYIQSARDAERHA